METVPKGRRPTNNKAFEKIQEAGSKEVVVTRNEWKLVIPPGKYILRKYLQREYKVAALLNKKGWVIKRI